MLFSYLRDRRKIFLLIFCFGAIFCGVFALFVLPIQAVLYAAVLCMAVSVPVILVDFSKYRQLHRILSGLAACPRLLPEDLPDACTLAEQDWRNIAEKLCREQEEALNAWEREQQETGDFYTLWLHQIKTPLAAMSVLLQQRTDEEAARLRQELFKTEQYAGLVLQYQRLGSIATDLHAVPCDLDKIVRESVKKYAPMFIYKKLKLVTENLSQTVISDEKWLAFLLEQLLSNALKYTHTGEIRISAENQPESGISLTIADTGIGIRAEDLPRIFERGFTGENGRTDKKATGLGLYLCDRVAKKLCHTLSVTSTLGKGTAVTIAFGRQEMVKD